MLATDDAWVDVSWEGTEQKSSFVKQLDVIHKLITDTATSTFPSFDLSFWNSRIKTHLRHTNERIGNKKKTDSKGKASKGDKMDES